MRDNPVAENVLATIGAILWTIQIIPQIWKSYRTKSTEGLSALLMLTWAWACWFLGSYLIAQRLSIPLIIQPQSFGLLAAVSVAQCLYYSRRCSKRNAVLFVLCFAVTTAGFETGSVFALWKAEERGITAAAQFYGYFSAILLAIALLPQYYEIWQHREVKGISMTFMAVDILGGVFSFSSLFFRPELDLAAFMSYLLVVILDGIVVLLALILNPLARKRRARAELETEREAAVTESQPVTSTPDTLVEGVTAGDTTGGVVGDDRDCTNEEKRDRDSRDIPIDMSEKARAGSGKEAS